VTQVIAADVPIYSEYPAQTYARNTVEVRGRVDGYIDKWLFRPGQEVHAGDVLYVLDLRPYQAAVEQAKGNVAQSEADREFAQKQVALLQAEANLAAAQANLVKAQQDYDRLLPLVKEEAAAKQELDAATAALGGERRPDASSNPNADRFHGGEGGCPTRCSPNSFAELGVCHDSGAHQWSDRRHASASGRSGQRQLATAANHHRSTGSHLGAVQGVRIAIPRVQEEP
jgi:pyruvate/2-oxoglutarate dehydrogenase complex dihydrolipoamide acyltransferase (E2) component